MNAYELANELENKDRLWNVDENLMLKNCAMLRQQADRIETLQTMLAEYTALMMQQKHLIAELEKQLNTPKTYVLDGKQVFDTTPQIKELSDEEILKMIAHKFHYTEYKLAIEFARAILKKASEK